MFILDEHMETENDTKIHSKKGVKNHSKVVSKNMSKKCPKVPPGPPPPPIKMIFVYFVKKLSYKPPLFLFFSEALKSYSVYIYSGGTRSHHLPPRSQSDTLYPIPIPPPTRMQKGGTFLSLKNHTQKSLPKGGSKSIQRGGLKSSLISYKFIPYLQYQLFIPILNFSYPIDTFSIL